MDPEIEALAIEATEWLFGNLPKREHGSLQIVGVDARGDRVGIKIVATDDRDMLAKAAEAVRRLRLVRFVGAGEGQILIEGEAPMKVVIYYVEATDAPGVRRLLREYRERDGGFVLLDPLYDGGAVGSSWVSI